MSRGAAYSKKYWRVESTPVWFLLDASGCDGSRACEKEESSAHKRTALEPLPRAVADEQTLSRPLVQAVFEGAGIIHAAQPSHMRCGKEKLE